MYTNSLFQESWWLDAIAPGQWIELKVEENGIVLARWTIIYANKKIALPRYTPSTAIWLNKDYIQTTADEEKVYLKLIEQLPKTSSIEICLSPENHFYLPFLWNDFDVTPVATYIIDDLSDLDAVFHRMSKSIQRDIKQASKKVEVKITNDILKLIKMTSDTYARQGRSYIVNEDNLKRLYAAAYERGACTLLEAVDSEGHTHSMTLFVYDSNRCYYLVGASDPVLNAKSCANTLLIWEGIKIASQHSKIFDFEGSSIHGIGTFFRRFGAKFSFSFRISKHNLKGNLYKVIKPRVKKILGHKK